MWWLRRSPVRGGLQRPRAADQAVRLPVVRAPDPRDRLHGAGRGRNRAGAGIVMGDDPEAMAAGHSTGRRSSGRGATRAWSTVGTRCGSGRVVGASGPTDRRHHQGRHMSTSIPSSAPSAERRSTAWSPDLDGGIAWIAILALVDRRRHRRGAAFATGVRDRGRRGARRGRLRRVALAARDPGRGDARRPWPTRRSRRASCRPASTPGRSASASRCWPSPGP